MFESNKYLLFCVLLSLSFSSQVLVCFERRKKKKTSTTLSKVEHNYNEDPFSPKPGQSFYVKHDNEVINKADMIK